MPGLKGGSRKPRVKTAVLKIEMERGAVSLVAHLPAPPGYVFWKMLRNKTKVTVYYRRFKP